MATTYTMQGAQGYPAHQPPPYKNTGDPDVSPMARRGSGTVSIALPKNCANISSIVLSIAIAALTATAAYYMLSYGFNRLDFAVTRMDMFVGGTMAYMGVAYGVVSLANVCMTCFGHVLADNFEDRKTIVAAQVAGSVLAPIAILPAAAFFGLQVAVK
ncbi:MAG: hypothetical protein S4CHLAM45_07030 [Chlamydiales bacterium]|nr:hypothetical protein [Chlamydiales bacterium]MCH9620279.1 hypothetical protein [Chlamydiales bacterium]MCH9622810.1 hypothetical protein [Chlamydiales bacterium]